MCQQTFFLEEHKVRLWDGFCEIPRRAAGSFCVAFDLRCVGRGNDLSRINIDHLGNRDGIETGRWRCAQCVCWFPHCWQLALVTRPTPP